MKKQKKVNLKKKGGFKFLRAGASGVASYLRSYDDYGQPIAFNYEGSDTFQTIPGALLSIIARCILLLYFLYRGRSLILNQNWNLTTQTTNQTGKDLSELLPIADHSNLTLGIEIDVPLLNHNVHHSKYTNFSRILHKYTSLRQYNYQMTGYQMSFLDGAVEGDYSLEPDKNRVDVWKVHVHD